MKNLLNLSLLLCISFLVLSCQDDDTPGVPVPINIPTVVESVEIPFATIDGVELPGPINVNLNVDFEQVVDEQVNIPGFSLENIASAKLQEFKIELNDSSFVGDLSAIKDIDIYVKAANPDIAEIKVAQVRDNTNEDVINFEVVEDGNIVDYFKSEDTIIVLRDIVGGDNSLTTFTVKITPVWKFSFQL